MQKVSTGEPFLVKFFLFSFAQIVLWYFESFLFLGVGGRQYGCKNGQQNGRSFRSALNFERKVSKSRGQQELKAAKSLFSGKKASWLHTLLSKCWHVQCSITPLHCPSRPRRT